MPTGSPPTPPALLKVESAIEPYGRPLVAFSGGVDSGVVAAAAYRVKGTQALAVTLAGPAVSREEVERACHVAATIGIPHRIVQIDPLKDEGYAANPSNRCYFCRHLEGETLVRLAQSEGFAVVVDGLHRDDAKDDRPGRRAMDELGIRHPLWEAGVGKREVRLVAEHLGLPNHATPANSCLASRIPHGERITLEALGRVEKAEAYLHGMGFRQVRVRSSLGTARLEVGHDELPRLQDPELQAQIQAHLLTIGFLSVLTDPRGYRPGGASP